MPVENIKDMLRHNAEFVKNEEYKKYTTSKYPDKKIVIVTCMDTRLVTLLPAALGINNGDVKMIKNAGGLVTDPFDSSMRSILVAVYELGVKHVMIIAHTGCGVQGMDGHHFVELMKEQGLPEENIEIMRHSGIDVEKWLTGFEDTEAAVAESVELVKNHPLLPADVEVTGYIMETETGRLIPL